MLGLIQRVAYAEVKVNDQSIARIEKGILALIGIEKSDTIINAKKLLDKILSYRIFEDAFNKMNLSVLDINGALLLVPQFTLAADTKTGTRPGFSTAMPPEESKKLFELFITEAHAKSNSVASGKFGAHMQVILCNDGPVTFLLKG